MGPALEREKERGDREMPKLPRSQRTEAYVIYLSALMWCKNNSLSLSLSLLPARSSGRSLTLGLLSVRIDYVDGGSEGSKLQTL